MRWIGIAMLLGLVGCASRHAVSDADAAGALSEGKVAMERGDFEQAARKFEQASVKGDARERAEALIQLASAQQTLGRFDLAVGSLDEALLLANSLDDRSLKARAFNGLGVAFTFNPRTDAKAESLDANGALQQALELSRELKDARLEAGVLTNLANFHARNGRYPRAQKLYDEAARAAPDDLTAARALVNAAVATLSAGEDLEEDAADAVTALNDRLTGGFERLARVNDSHDKAFLYLTVGRTAEQAGALDPKATQKQQAMARSAYETALAIAEKINDARSRSYACGYLGGMELAAGRSAEAEKLTRRAIMAAQQIRSPDALYRWQWQNARILKAKWNQTKSAADLDAAAAFYDAAVQTVKFIRNDISLGYGNQRKQLSFRESIGSLYFEYADVLLQRSDSSVDRDELYRQARGTIEQLKAVELENYFQDECVSLIKRKKKGLEDLDDRTAVIYMIPLADRVEILVSFRGGKFFRAKNESINAAALRKLAERFRRQMVSTDTTAGYDYRDTGRTLYDALIKPIRGELDARRIDTLVFVPDGPLRTIPMAALVDDKEKHLVETFAIGISPGLELLEPRSITSTQIDLLAGGLSTQLPEFPEFKALTFVPVELDNLQKLYPQGARLQDDDFRPAQLKIALDARSYSIVHVATHAQFGATAKDSFLLTSDGKMQLDEVERLIRPYQLRNQPVELLTLSACQTAEGDQERAALGIAGIAVKAGARSAIATLWKVNERASVELITQFYSELKGSTVSKARAMREAQMKLIAGQQFEHPHYWAPFVVIGNWL